MSSRRSSGARREVLWPRLELYFATATHPLRGESLDAAKASLGLAQELFVAYKRVLEHEATSGCISAAAGRS